MQAKHWMYAKKRRSARARADSGADEKQRCVKGTGADTDGAWTAAEPCAGRRHSTHGRPDSHARNRPQRLCGELVVAMNGMHPITDCGRRADPRWIVTEE